MVKNTGRVMPLPKGNHDSTKPYEILDIVKNGNASYIAKKNVPENTLITNDEYWQKFVDGDELIIDDASLTKKGIVQLTNSSDGTSETLALTQKGAKDIKDTVPDGINYDKTNSELQLKVGDTVVDTTTIESGSETIESTNVIMDSESELTLAEWEQELTYAQYKAKEEAGTLDPDVKYIVPDYPDVTRTVDQELSSTSTNAISNKATTIALGGKQDKTDNSLTTTSKEIVGAVNELNSNLVASDNLKFRFATDGEGNYGYQNKDGEFVSFGEGSGASIQIDVSTTSDSFVGKTVNAIYQNVIVTSAVFDASKKVSLKVKEYGDYIIQVEDDEVAVEVTAAQLYKVTINESPKAIINVSTATNSFIGKNVTCSDGTTTITKQFSDTKIVQFKVKTTGTWTINCEGYTNTVNVTDLTATYNTEVHIPYATINVTTKETEWYGSNVVLKKGSTTVETKQFSVAGTCSFVVYETGTYTIESNEKSKEVNVNQLDTEYAVSINGLEIVTFAGGTDEQIVAMIEAHYNNDINIADYWSVGDTRNVSLSAMGDSGIKDYDNRNETHSAQTVQMVIIGINHDDLVTPINGHTKAAITLNQKDCMKLESNSTYQYENSTRDRGLGAMNNYTGSHTNAGGWRDCSRRTWCNNSYKNALPTLIKNAVKTVAKKTSAGSQSSTIVTTNDDVFLLSEIEIFGSTTYSFAGEGSQYSYFSLNTANRYKNPVWSSGNASAYWWGRSPYSSNSTGFCYVRSSGSAGSSVSGLGFGVAPACCL